MFLFLSRENFRSEEKLKKAILEVEKVNHELDDQRARTFSSSKFAALGEMAGGIAHEVNNPMTVINLNAQQLQFILSQDKVDHESANKCVEVITRTVHRVAKIINSLRNFSRDATRETMEHESARKIIDDTLTFCSERFKNYGIELKTKIPSENITFKCNAVQVSQVILNLLNNSFDAVETLEDRWVEIEVSKKPHYVILSVTDSGWGIPEAEHEKIFQPFYTTKPVGKGTGLGLSLSRKIVEDHGGRIMLDKLSKHTRFTIEFPTIY
jgi:C4-dicarboxylate-specific signal transduction histidine kinase